LRLRRNGRKMEAEDRFKMAMAPFYEPRWVESCFFLFVVKILVVCGNFKIRVWVVFCVLLEFDNRIQKFFYITLKNQQKIAFLSKKCFENTEILR
jgi:hypothetical protein